MLPSVLVPMAYKLPCTLRNALGEAGCGKIGNYDFCSFSSKGFGRFRPLKGSNPKIGETDKLEVVAEERIEVVCEKSRLTNVLAAIKEAHPYEEPATDVYPLI